MAEPEALADDQILAGFGYRQELRRALRLFSLFAVAFSIISITTGIFTNYGFGLAHMGPAFIWTWPVAVAGQLLVGLVVSELGTRIPSLATPTSGARAWSTRPTAGSSASPAWPTSPWARPPSTSWSWLRSGPSSSAWTPPTPTPT